MAVPTPATGDPGVLVRLRKLDAPYKTEAQGMTHFHRHFKRIFTTCLMFLGICLVVILLPVGCFIAMEREINKSIERLTYEADGLVKIIYKFKNRTGHYPKTLQDLTAGVDGVTPDDISNIKRSHMGDYIYSFGIGMFNPKQTMDWRYSPGSGSEDDPPKLYAIGSLDHGRYLGYDFRSTHAFYMPPGKDEGWVTGTEGDRRYLRSVDFANQTHK